MVTECVEGGAVWTRETCLPRGRGDIGRAGVRAPIVAEKSWKRDGAKGGRKVDARR